MQKIVSFLKKKKETVSWANIDKDESENTSDNRLVKTFKKTTHRQNGGGGSGYYSSTSSNASNKSSSTKGSNNRMVSDDDSDEFIGFETRTISKVVDFSKSERKWLANLKITDQQVDQHIDVLLNVLNFLSKKEGILYVQLTPQKDGQSNDPYKKYHRQPSISQQHQLLSSSQQADSQQQHPSNLSNSTTSINSSITPSTSLNNLNSVSSPNNINNNNNSNNVANNNNNNNITSTNTTDNAMSPISNSGSCANDNASSNTNTTDNSNNNNNINNTSSGNLSNTLNNNTNTPATTNNSTPCTVFSPVNNNNNSNQNLAQLANGNHHHHHQDGAALLEKVKTKGDHDRIFIEPGKYYPFPESESFALARLVVEEEEPSKLFRMGENAEVKGAYGTVFHVYHVSGQYANMEMALKKMDHKSEKNRRNNLNEIAILRYLKHPNIVSFINAYEKNDEEIWMVMEYMDCGTIKEAISNFTFTEKYVGYITKQILHALEYIHSINIAHRDLKSANIMINTKAEVKLIDFGFAIDLTLLKADKHMCGSPFWMSPEQIQEKPHGLSTDIWSLGMVVAEMMKGVVPHHKSKIKAMFLTGSAGIKFTKEKKWSSHWSNELFEFLETCLQTDPSKRPTPTQLLEHPFIANAATKTEMLELLPLLFMSKTISKLSVKE
ncbi:hypothetical protein CYY_008328 [Polysphondylium violaceum]|uniref:Protein kinase domain-containing protein n=1 Tax=Polysphondylium violaceum TaxID=133409 RepID=A0A8J4PNR7_9MYCE|nr:hypothetical protein CYY_008328 [Polysphondylium violaceum]